MEIVGLLGVAAFFVPVADERARPELAVEVGGLLDDEVLVHAVTLMIILVLHMITAGCWNRRAG